MLFFVTVMAKETGLDKLKINIVDKQSGTILSSFSMDNSDKAHDYATEMEEMGVDVEIHAPSLPESLISELGASSQDVETLRQELDEEIEGHGCCPASDSNDNAPTHEKS